MRAMNVLQFFRNPMYIEYHADRWPGHGGLDPTGERHGLASFLCTAPPQASTCAPTLAALHACARAPVRAHRAQSAQCLRPGLGGNVFGRLGPKGVPSVTVRAWKDCSCILFLGHCAMRALP
mmetsp:Transcript_105979/g.285034  ORF Transcript_105979/g.285034 Transcript_105979/m.285034 type:complete len:122 (-) Transcript_105979:7-372(-)